MYGFFSVMSVLVGLGSFSIGSHYQGVLSLAMAVVLFFLSRRESSKRVARKVNASEQMRDGSS